MRRDVQRQFLAEFYAPLIERVDVPNYALRVNAMFVQSNELP